MFCLFSSSLENLSIESKWGVDTVDHCILLYKLRATSFSEASVVFNPILQVAAVRYLPKGINPMYANFVDRQNWQLATENNEAFSS